MSIACILRRQASRVQRSRGRALGATGNLRARVECTRSMSCAHTRHPHCTVHSLIICTSKENVEFNVASVCICDRPEIGNTGTLPLNEVSDDGIISQAALVIYKLAKSIFYGLSNFFRIREELRILLPFRGTRIFFRGTFLKGAPRFRGEL